MLPSERGGWDFGVVFHIEVSFVICMQERDKRRNSILFFISGLIICL